MPSLDFFFFSASVPTENAKGMRTPAWSGFEASLPGGKPSFSCSLDLTVIWLVSRSGFASSQRSGLRCMRVMSHGVKWKSSGHVTVAFLAFPLLTNEWQTTLDNRETNCPDYFQGYWIYCHSYPWMSNRLERLQLDFMMSRRAHFSYIQTSNVISITQTCSSKNPMKIRFHSLPTNPHTSLENLIFFSLPQTAPSVGYKKKICSFS